MVALDSRVLPGSPCRLIALEIGRLPFRAELGETHILSPSSGHIESHPDPGRASIECTAGPTGRLILRDSKKIGNALGEEGERVSAFPEGLTGFPVRLRPYLVVALRCACCVIHFNGERRQRIPNKELQVFGKPILWSGEQCSNPDPRIQVHGQGLHSPRPSRQWTRFEMRLPNRNTSLCDGLDMEPVNRGAWALAHRETRMTVRCWRSTCVGREL